MSTPPTSANLCHGTAPPRDRSRSGSELELELQQLRQLLAVLQIVMAEIRVGPRRDLARAGLEVLTRRAQSASAGSDEVGELCGDLLGLFAHLGDAHTRLAVGRPGSDRLPFDLRCDVDGYFVSAADPREGPPLGARITHWNGRSIESVHREIACRIAHGGVAARARRALTLLTRRPRAALGRSTESWVDLELARSESDGAASSWRGIWSSETAHPGTLARAGAVSDAWLDGSPDPLAENSVDLLARGASWRLVDLRGCGLTLLQLSSIPAEVELDALRNALRCAASRSPHAGERPLLLDLRANPGGEVDGALALHAMLSPARVSAEERWRLRFQFADTCLTRRLLGAHPTWRACAKPGADGFLAARPLSETCDEPPVLQPAQAELGLCCAGLLVDDETFSAAEILGHLLREDGVPVFGDVSATCGGTTNAWAYPTLQELVPNARVDLSPGHDRTGRRRALAEYVARRAPGSRVQELTPGARWWIYAAPDDSNDAATAGSLSAQLARAPRADGCDNEEFGDDALLIFDRTRPVFPDLPCETGLQFGVRRAVLCRGNELRELGPLTVDQRLPQGGAREEFERLRWISRQLELRRARGTVASERGGPATDPAPDLDFCLPPVGWEDPCGRASVSPRAINP